MDPLMHQRDQPLTENLNKHPRDSESQFLSETDATGYWFAAAVVVAFLAAGVIVYRIGNQEIRTAANDVSPAAAQADPLQPPDILQTR